MPSSDKLNRGPDSPISTALGALRSEVPSVPAGLVDDILSYVFEGGTDSDHERSVRIWWFITAGAFAAVVGGAATGVLIRWRQGKLPDDLARLRRLAAA